MVWTGSDGGDGGDGDDGTNRIYCFCAQRKTNNDVYGDFVLALGIPMCALRTFLCATHRKTLETTAAN